MTAASSVRRLAVWVLAAFATCAAAQVAPPAKAPATVAAEVPPKWSALSAAEKSALRPLQAEWPRLDAQQKAKWLVVAGRFPTMAEADRQRLQERMAEWARLSPADRGRARQNFQALRNIRPEDQRALWDAYQALPPETRRELAKRPASARPVPAADAKAQVAGKRNIVPPSTQQVAGKPATPTMIQARPGATTTLVTKRPTPPSHHQPGLPKIAATQGFVNPSTLLPSRGPQGAAAVAPPASAPAVAE